MQDRVDSKINIADDAEITKPHAKPVHKELMLVTLGDPATLPEDSTVGYDPHVTGITTVSPETTPIPEEAKKKGLYHHFNLHTTTLSPKGNPINVTLSVTWNITLHWSSFKWVLVNTWDGLCKVPEHNLYICDSYQQFLRHESIDFYGSGSDLPRVLTK